MMVQWVTQHNPSRSFRASLPFLNKNKMRTINIHSKEDIEEIVNERIEKNLSWVYEELNKLRLKIIDLEKIIKKK